MIVDIFSSFLRGNNLDRRFMTVPEIYLAALLAMRHCYMIDAYETHRARRKRESIVCSEGIDRSSVAANMIGSKRQRSKAAKREILKSKNVRVSNAYDAEFLMRNGNLLLEALEILLKHDLRNRCCAVTLGYACENVSKLTGIPLSLR